MMHSLRRHYPVELQLFDFELTYETDGIDSFCLPTVVPQGVTRPLDFPTTRI